MALTFSNVELEGPFSRLDELKDAAGVFAILCYRESRFNLLAVEVAEQVQTEVANLVARSDWSDVCSGKVRVAVYYTTDGTEASKIKDEIQSEIE